MIEGRPRHKTGQGIGFWFAFLLNLIFRAEWLVFALVCLVLHTWLGTPLWLVWIALGLWVLVSLAVTALLSYGAASAKKLETPGSQRASERRAMGTMHSTPKQNKDTSTEEKE